MSRPKGLPSSTCAVYLHLHESAVVTSWVDRVRGHGTVTLGGSGGEVTLFVELDQVRQVRAELDRVERELIGHQASPDITPTGGSSTGGSSAA